MFITRVTPCRKILDIISLENDEDAVMERQSDNCDLYEIFAHVYYPSDTMQLSSGHCFVEKRQRHS